MKVRILFPLRGFLALLNIILMCLYSSVSLAQIHFEDVSLVSGISRWGDSYGASWGDFNGDGWPDLWVGNHVEKPSLFINNSDGTFTEATYLVKRYNGFEQHGAAWADFDNDGDQDLIQIVGGGRHKGTYPNQFFINSGGFLQNRANHYGLDYPLGRGRTPLWFDWNFDGYLDVLVTNMNRSDGKKAPSVLFTQKSDFFSNDNGLTIETNLGSKFGQLFISNFLGNPAIVVHGHPSANSSRIYQYDQTPFHDITERIGFPKTGSIFDAAIADFNNDLLNDFFLITDPKARLNDQLLIQNLEGFKDYTELAGLNMPTSCVSVASADFDNDMDIDLYLVCTWLNGCNIPNRLYENLGNNTFKVITSAGGAEGSSYGRGDTVAIADYDNDGFIDLFVTNKRDSYDEENSHNQLFRNVGNDNHWIEIELEGVVSNRDGIGSVIKVSTNGVTQMRVQNGGIHRVAQDHQRIHFGLGKNTLINEISIQWPSGIVQKISNITVDQIINVIELDFTVSKTSGTPPFRIDVTSNKRGDYQAATYKWDFDHDGTMDSNDQNPTYIYKNPGIFTIKVTAMDLNGNINTSIRENYIKVLNKE